MALDDDQPLSGAQFARQVGADPEKWAQNFLAVYHENEAIHTDADRLVFVAGWFRDAMEAAVKAAGRQEWPPDPEWEENKRRAMVAREHEVARRHSGEPSE